MSRVSATTAQGSLRWTLWEDYAADAISSDGRVIEHAREARTTSEGQAYSMFFALVVNDRARFDLLWNWTLANLWPAHAPTPAWLWGSSFLGQWGIIDNNSASDADLWMAYSLLEASRLWNDSRYQDQAEILLAAIFEQEIVRLSDGSYLLLPGRLGFKLGDSSYLLNPSYAPVQLLRRLEAHAPEGPWSSVLENQLKLLKGSAPHGLVPDWAIYAEGRGYSYDRKHQATGGYDAIRNYLWLGTVNRNEPVFVTLRDSLMGMHRLMGSRAVIPHFVNAKKNSSTPEGAPPGFTAALYPYASAVGDTGLASLLEARIQRYVADPARWKQMSYYDRNLTLFAMGWSEGWYSFGLQGQLRRGI